MIEAKYPLNKCLILNHDNRTELEEEFGQDFNDLINRKGPQNQNRTSGLYDFVDRKIGKLAFPSYACYQSAHDYQIKKYGKEIAGRPMFHTENGCVIELPASYDSSHDLAEHVELKMEYMSQMKKILGKKFKEEDHEKHVDFGSSDFSYINELLSFFHSKFSEHYVDGKLSVFLDYKDEENWNADRETKTNLVDYPYPKAFYLSEIENHLQNDYGMNTSELYQGILDDMYVEGRYWERFFYSEFSATNFRDKKYSKNYVDMVNLIKVDFKDHFVKNWRFEDNQRVLPIYIDYRKDNIKL